MRCHSCAIVHPYQIGESLGRDRREMHAVADGQKAQGILMVTELVTQHLIEHRMEHRMEHHERRAPDQTPATRRGERIDARLMTSDTNAAGRNAAARRAETGRHQGFGKSAEIGEAGDEA